MLKLTLIVLKAEIEESKLILDLKVNLNCEHINKQEGHYFAQLVSVI